MKFTLFCQAALALSLLQAPARAETASEFLKSLEGDFSGRGSAVVVGKDTTKISCKLSNRFAESSNSLNVAGECASTKGKGKVSGTVTASNDQLKGNFVSTRQNVKVTKSDGQYANGKMVLSTMMMDEKVGRLIRVRQSVERTDGGIKATFFTYDNATQEYKPAGSISLKKQ